MVIYGHTNNIDLDRNIFHAPTGILCKIVSYLVWNEMFSVKEIEIAS